jgi:hypothetical protein
MDVEKSCLQDDIEEEDRRLEQLCLKLYMLQYFKMYFYVNVSLCGETMERETTVKENDGGR